MATWNHRVKNVDENGNGICGKCGPVQFVWRAYKGRWQCPTARREQQCGRNTEEHRESWYLRAYGITEAEYQELLIAQSKRCAICRKKPKEKRLHVDHNHETGKVRGLLCFNCNGGLGQFKDDPKLIRRAYKYLKAHADTLSE